MLRFAALSPKKPKGARRSRECRNPFYARYRPPFTLETVLPIHPLCGHPYLAAGAIQQAQGAKLISIECAHDGRNMAICETKSR